MPVRSAAGSTDGKPALTSLCRENAGLGHPPQPGKNISSADTPLSSSFECVHSFSGFCSQAVVSCSSLLHSSSSSSCGHSMPSSPCSFTHPYGGGPLYSPSFTDDLGPFLHSAISTCPAVLHQNLVISPATCLPTFFPGGMVILLSFPMGNPVLVEGPCTSSESHPLSGTPPTIQPLLPAGVSPPRLCNKSPELP